LLEAINAGRFADGGVVGRDTSALSGVRFQNGGHARSGGMGGGVMRWATEDLWELAHAVSQVTLELNGEAVSRHVGRSMEMAGVGG
jgi:hypothetical protein